MTWGTRIADVTVGEFVMIYAGVVLLAMLLAVLRVAVSEWKRRRP